MRSGSATPRAHQAAAGRHTAGSVLPLSHHLPLLRAPFRTVPSAFPLLRSNPIPPANFPLRVCSHGVKNFMKKPLSKYGKRLSLPSRPPGLTAAQMGFLSLILSTSSPISSPLIGGKDPSSQPLSSGRQTYRPTGEAGIHQAVRYGWEIPNSKVSCLKIGTESSFHHMAEGHDSVSHHIYIPLSFHFH